MTNTTPKTTPFTRLPGVLALLGLVAAAAPAQAGVTIYPGANCRTEGASEMLTNGELRSAQIVTGSLNDNNITKFSCPVVLTRTNTNFNDSSVSATVYARTNTNSIPEFYCLLRITRADGTVHDTAKISITQGGPPAAKSKTGVATLPPVAVYASAHLRCDVPRSASINDVGASIISYQIED